MGVLVFVCVCVIEVCLVYGVCLVLGEMVPCVWCFVCVCVWCCVLVMVAFGVVVCGVLGVACAWWWCVG